MRIKGRTHSSSFKAKMALAAWKEAKTLAELAEQFDVQLNQTTDWKRQMDNAEQLFERSEK